MPWKPLRSRWAVWRLRWNWATSSESRAWRSAMLVATRLPLQLPDGVGRPEELIHRDRLLHVARGVHYVHDPPRDELPEPFLTLLGPLYKLGKLRHRQLRELPRRQADQPEGEG